MGAQNHTQIHEGAHAGHNARTPVRVAVVTVSDTRTEADDEGGRLIREHCQEAGFTVVSSTILKDEPADIAAHVRTVAGAGQVNAVLLTGGTGVARRDTTVEALGGIFDKTLDGFGELFRSLSFAEVGPAAMLSRATAGTVGKTAVFLMPGSPKAVRLAMSRLIVPTIGHVVALLDDGPDAGRAPAGHHHHGERHGR